MHATWSTTAVCGWRYSWHLEDTSQFHIHQLMWFWLFPLKQNIKNNNERVKIVANMSKWLSCMLFVKLISLHLLTNLFQSSTGWSSTTRLCTMNLCLFLSLGSYTKGCKQTENFRKIWDLKIIVYFCISVTNFQSWHAYVVRVNRNLDAHNIVLERSFLSWTV